MDVYVHLCWSLLLSFVATSVGVQLIVDTDMGFDVDDVGAVCLANALQHENKTEVLAIVHDTGCALGIGGVSAINHFYGHDHILLGAFKGKFGSDCNTHFKGALGQNQYLSKLTDNSVFAGPVTRSTQVPNATETYRKALSIAQDSSVHIASIGMTTNLRDLLKTKGDAHSPLNGYDLIQKKVARVVYMDGGYNFGCAAGFVGPAEDCYGSAKLALEMPPNVSLVFSGEGANPPIYTGSGLQEKTSALTLILTLNLIILNLTLSITLNVGFRSTTQTTARVEKRTRAGVATLTGKGAPVVVSAGIQSQ